MDWLWGIREREVSRVTAGSGLCPWVKDGPDRGGVGWRW